MLLPSQKPSSSYSLSKFVYVTSQLRHSLVVHPFLRKILDRSLLCATHMLSVPYCSALRIQEMIESKRRTLFYCMLSDVHSKYSVCLALLPSLLYRFVRFVNFEGILGFSFPSIISLGAALMQIIIFERARLDWLAKT